MMQLLLQNVRMLLPCHEAHVTDWLMEQWSLFLHIYKSNVNQHASEFAYSPTPFMQGRKAIDVRSRFAVQRPSGHVFWCTMSDQRLYLVPAWEFNNQLSARL